MKSMILDSEKCKFLHILKQSKERRVEVFTQVEISKHLRVSLRKIIDFENGKIFDFWLLCRYCSINGYGLKFWI